MKLLSNFSLVGVVIIALLWAGCKPSPNSADEDQPMTKSGLKISDFQSTLHGKETSLYVLRNDNGMEICISNYGARVVSLMAPDRNGLLEDVVLGFSSLKGYLEANEVYHGATIGRYANRIAGGKFVLNNKEYVLNQNNGSNNLHGGPNGFHHVVWTVDQASHQEIRLSYLSVDGEEGFPGNLDVRLTYSLNDDNEFSVEYEARTDQPTPVNLTHHSFFNLSGEGRGRITDHILHIDADSFNPVDANLIPTGIETVEDTPFDFRSPKAIGKQINDDHIQIRHGGGYDHNFILSHQHPYKKGTHYAARVVEPASGRIMEVFTDEPGLQFYSGNFLSGADTGKRGSPYEHRTAFCLETQHFPDSPNQKSFPSTILYPDKTYKSICLYKFASE